MPGAVIAAPNSFVNVCSGPAYQAARMKDMESNVTHMVAGGVDVDWVQD